MLLVVEPIYTKMATVSLVNIIPVFISIKQDYSFQVL